MTIHSSLRLTELFSNTLRFAFKHFFALLVAVGVPFLLSYIVIWLTVGAVVKQINDTSAFEELVALFTFSSPVTYTLLITGVIALAMNIMGWIAGPLLTITQGNITVLQLFPKAAKYFWSYFALALMVIAGVVVLELAVFLLITIVITIVGFVDTALIAVWENYLVSILPDVALLLFTVGLMFAPYFLIDQRLSAWQAVQASLKLVKQHFGNVLIRFILIAAIIILITFLLQFVPIFGGALAYLLSSIVLTVYNYYLYKGFTDYGARYSQ